VDGQLLRVVWIVNYDYDHTSSCASCTCMATFCRPDDCTSGNAHAQKAGDVHGSCQVQKIGSSNKPNTGPMARMARLARMACWLGAAIGPVNNARGADCIQCRDVTRADVADLSHSVGNGVGTLHVDCKVQGAATRRYTAPLPASSVRSPRSR
jgi:hypothetical protein